VKDIFLPPDHQELFELGMGDDANGVFELRRRDGDGPALAEGIAAAQRGKIMAFIANLSGTAVRYEGFLK